MKYYINILYFIHIYKIYIFQIISNMKIIDHTHVCIYVQNYNQVHE